VPSRPVVSLLQGWRSWSDLAAKRRPASGPAISGMTSCLTARAATQN